MTLTKEDLPRLGLSSSQMRSQATFHNAGWYATSGEKLGWGDLAPDDIEHIKATLTGGEMLIVLYESDSFWNFVTNNPGLTGGHCTTSDDEADPGLGYLLEKACAVFTPGKLRRKYYGEKWEDGFEEEFAKALGIETEYQRAARLREESVQRELEKIKDYSPDWCQSFISVLKSADAWPGALDPRIQATMEAKAVGIETAVNTLQEGQ